MQPCDAKLAALIDKLQAGDQRALSDLYDATVAAVYSRALRITGHSIDAEDVTRAVYQQVWCAAKTFETEGAAEPLQWLLIITRHAALDYCRRRSDDGRIEKLDSAVEHMVYQPASSSLRAAFEHLDRVRARLIGLALFDGLSHLEIAECTRLSLDTVRSYLCEALMVIRKTLSASQIAKARTGAMHGSTVLNGETPTSG